MQGLVFWVCSIDVWSLSSPCQISLTVFYGHMQGSMMGFRRDSKPCCKVVEGRVSSSLRLRV